MTRLAMLIVLLLLGLGLASGPVEAAKPSKAETYAATAHAATNKQRSANGLRTLNQSRCLRRFAVRQAERMAASGVLGHQDLGPVLSRCGLRSAGENVAFGYPNGRSVVDAGWMKSAGHRANILGGFRLEGIGAVRARNGSWWVAQVFGTP